MPDTLPPDWTGWRRQVDVGDYDQRWTRMAAAGQNPHGEADLVTALLAAVAPGRPGTVLDGGCGTGRVAVELARRGVSVVGVDADPDMIAAAVAKAPQLRWHLCGLQDLDSALDPGERFDVVVLAGNVVPYVAAPDRAAAVTACARHTAPGGALVAGFQLRPGWPTLTEYDSWCAAAGLAPVAQWATWEREPYTGGDYAVSVHAAGGSALAGAHG